MPGENAPAAAFTTEVDANIARNLRRARESRGWSQAELAQRVTAIGVRGIHQTTIARIESGIRQLRAAEAVAVCRSLEITLERLAESGLSAELRSEIAWLQQRAQTFDESLRELLHARRVVAMRQDGQFPYTDDGKAAPEQVIASGVDPTLYEILEERIVSAAPHERLEISYLSELHDERLYERVGEGRHKGRLEFISEDMREWVDRGDGVDQAAP